MARNSRINSLLASIFVAISLPFYGFFRPNTWLGEIVQQTSFLSFSPLSSGITLSESPLLRMLNDAFPSFIWVFAFTVLMNYLWGGTSDNILSVRLSDESLQWILLPCVMNTFWECGQYTYIICGAGSLADILAGWTAVLLFIVLQRR